MKYDGMTLDELKSLYRERTGKNLRGFASRQRLLAALNGLPDPEGTDDAPTVEAAPAPKPEKQKWQDRYLDSSADPRVKIFIPMSNDPFRKASEEIEVLSVNGRLLRVPRGVECEIPMRYYRVMQNAIEHIVVSEVDFDSGGMERSIKEVPALPVMNLGVREP